ncbi:MAG: FG-GAP-like repeat-containing protein [Chthoniobacteraceae bacterium]
MPRGDLSNQSVLLLFFLSWLMAAIWSASATAAPIFAEPVRLANNGGGALGTTAGDLNNDGRAEFISITSKDSWSSTYQPQFRIYSYDPVLHGFFTYNVMSQAAVGSRQDRFGGDIAVGDINHDGFRDIIVPEADNGDGAGRLSWFENPAGNLGGNWIEHVITTWSGSPGNSVAHMAEVVVSDVDGNGWLDVVVRDVSHGCFLLLRNNSGTGWQNRRYIATNPREGLELWNPDGDGDLDILINGIWLETPADPLNGTYFQRTIAAQWYPNNNGSAAIADYASKVDFGDFNGDGRVDVVITNGEKLLNDPSTASKPQGVRLYLSPQDPVNGVWPEVLLDPLHFSWQSLQIGDIDGDGDLDIVTGISKVGEDNAAGTVVAFLNDGTGTNFTKQTIDSGKDGFNEDVYVYNCMLADMDGDGDLDLIAPDNWNSGPIRYYQNVTAVPAVQLPAAPAGLTASSVSISQIDLAWNDQSNNEAGFRIERSVNSSAFAQIAQTGAGVTAFSDSGLVSGSQYVYRVRAFNAVGNSAYSLDVSATTPTDTIAPVFNSVTSGTGGLVTAIFSEAVERASAENTANYTLTGGAVVTSSTLAADGRTVTLATGGLVDGNTYSLTAIGVRDVAAAQNASNTVGTFVHGAWLSQDIGSVAVAGSMVIAGAAITVAGSGADIYSVADGFRFAYRTFTGDVEIVARVASQTRAHPYSKAGVMIRETLTSGSKHALMALTPDFGGEMNYRATVSGTTGTVAYDPAVTPPVGAPYWVKIVRRGAVLTGSVSSDGLQWQQVAAATVSMASAVFVGLAVTSHNDGTLSTARFESVSIQAAVTPTVPGGLTANPASISRIDLAWNDQSNNEAGFKIERKTGTGGFQQIAQTAAGISTFSNSGLTPGTAYIYRVRAFNAYGDSAYSFEASAATPPDTTPPPDTTAPFFNSVTSGAGGLITIVFSEAVERASAESNPNYVLSGGVVVTSSTLATDGQTVTLATNGLVDGNLYSLTATGVRDTSAAHNPSNAVTVFTHAAWLNQDIGNVAVEGSMVISGPAITVAGSGADIYSVADGFQFAHRTFTGDVEVVARVASQTRADPYSKAGVMIRETLTSGSKHAFMALTPDFGGEMDYRATTLGATGVAVYNPAVVPRIVAPYWVKIVRQGAVLTGSVSSDGLQWQQVGTAVFSMASVVVVGLAVTSRNDGTLSTASFDNISIRPAVPAVIAAAPGGLTADPVSTSRIDLAWIDQSDNEAGFRVERRTVAGGFIQITQTASGVTVFSDSALAPATAYVYRIRAFNAYGDSAYSLEASATTLSDTTPPPDTTAPLLSSVTSVASGLVTAIFSEAVERASAENTANYTLSGGAVVNSSTLGTDGHTVILATTGLVDGNTYSLMANGVRDASAAHNPSIDFATFTHTAWLSRDIGSVAVAGSMVITGPAITVAGSGADIYSVADGFRFAHRTFTGDVEVVARVASQTRASPYSKAGVMIRESLTSGSKHALMALTPDFGGEMNYRATTAGTSGKVAFNPAIAPPVDAPYWVRIVRRGAVLTGSVSSDGVQWQQVGSASFSMASVVFIGLAVTSHSDGTLSTARFESIRIQAAGPPTAPAGLTATPISKSRIDLSWSDQSTNEAGFRIERKTGAADFFEVVQTAAGVTGFSDLGLAPGIGYIYRVRAFNAYGDSPNSGDVFAATPADAFLQWQQLNFGAAPDPLVAGDMEDPDHDFVVNLIEYFHGTNPVAGDGTGLPQISGGDRLRLAFTRSTSAIDVTATVQGTDSLTGPWLDLARSTNGGGFTALVSGVEISESGTDPFRSVSVSDRYTLRDAAHPRRFMRLVVVH